MACCDLPVLLNLADAGSAQIDKYSDMTGLTSIIGHVYPILAGSEEGKESRVLLRLV